MAAVLSATALIRPALLHYFYLAWNELGKILGWINTRLVMGALFYLVVTPIGLVAQLQGYFALRPDSTGGQESYRVESHEITRDSFERPF
jgi:hypothetical protein